MQRAVRSQTQYERATKAINSQVDSFRQSLPNNTSNYDKVRAAYEYVINQSDYDLSAPNGQNVVGVFQDKRSVCAEYSNAFCYLLRSVGVPCGCISGTIIGRGRHMWNIVTIDGINTLVDSTWGNPHYLCEDDGSISGAITYSYLCVTSAELAHTPTRRQPDNTRLYIQPL